MTRFHYDQLQTIRVGVIFIFLEMTKLSNGKFEFSSIYTLEEANLVLCRIAMIQGIVILCRLPTRERSFPVVIAPHLSHTSNDESPSVGIVLEQTSACSVVPSGS